LEQPVEIPDTIGFLSFRQIALGALYLVLAGGAAWQTVRYTNGSTGAIDQINEAQNFGNEAAQVSAKFVAQHRIVGAYLAKDLRRDFKLPSIEDSSRALAQIQPLQALAQEQDSEAAWWSWLLLGLSAAYLVLSTLRPGRELARNLLFAITGVSAVFFVVGISATALEIFTVIKNFFGTTPVIQHQVRSIYSVILELFSTNHWIFGGFITLFSIATPTAKLALTYLAALTSSSTANQKIAKFLKAIGKWSMADVFVAAVLLACFTLRAGDGTQVLPCRGLYYFAGYCLLSMVTTSMLSKLNFDWDSVFDSEGQLGIPVVGELIGIAVVLGAVWGLQH
jgi:paraquat-inducible protein A